MAQPNAVHPVPGVHQPAVVKDVCNRNTFRYYHSLFTNWLCGPVCKVTELICAIQDIHTPEIYAAFTAAIDMYVLALEGGDFKMGQLDMLSTEIEIVLKLLCHESFGDSDRNIYPAWFYLRWSEFLNEVTKDLLQQPDKVEEALIATPLQIENQKKAFQTLFAIAKGMRHVLPNDTVQSGTGTFAILVNIACDKSHDMSRSVLSAGKYKAKSMPSINWRHAIFMEEISKNILVEVPNDERTISKWNNSFSFFLGCQDWRALAQRILTLPFQIRDSHENMVPYLHSFMHQLGMVMAKEFKHYHENKQESNKHAQYFDLGESYRECGDRKHRSSVKRLREY